MFMASILMRKATILLYKGFGKKKRRLVGNWSGADESPFDQIIALLYIGSPFLKILITQQFIFMAKIELSGKKRGLPDSAARISHITARHFNALSFVKYGTLGYKHSEEKGARKRKFVLG
jgi:hypothetical protein